MKYPAIRVCLVSPKPPPYGGIAHWTALILSYAKSRSDVLIFHVNIAPTWRSIHSTGIFLRSFGGVMQLVSDVIRLFLCLCRNKIDVIHLTSSGQLGVVRDLVVAAVAKVFRVPLYLHVRFGRIPLIAVQNSIEWRLLRLAMLMSNGVVLIDKHTFEAVQKHVPTCRAELIPNCVDIRRLPPAQLPRRSAVRTVLFLGWVIPTKGMEELLSAWKGLEEVPGWRLDLIGSFKPEYRDYLVEKYGAKNVNFLGELPHDLAMANLASCDLFVFPSHTEGFPNVIAEAMALGRAILATDVGAIPEMLAGGAGIIVNSKDVGVLKRTLGELMLDSQLCISLGDAAKSRAIQHYSIDAVFNGYVRLWRSAIAEE